MVKGRVRKHAPSVHLEDVTFVVWKGGQKRALKEGVKNVHAFARGTEKRVFTKPVDAVRLRYHVVDGAFCDKFGKEWKLAKEAWMDENGCLFAVT